MSLSRSETRTGRAQDWEIDKDWRVLCQALASLFEGEDGVDELNVPGSNWERLPGWVILGLILRMRNPGCHSQLSWTLARWIHRMRSSSCSSVGWSQNLHVFKHSMTRSLINLLLREKEKAVFTLSILLSTFLVGETMSTLLLISIPRRLFNGRKLHRTLHGLHLVDIYFSSNDPPDRQETAERSHESSSIFVSWEFPECSAFDIPYRNRRSRRQLQLPTTLPFTPKRLAIWSWDFHHYHNQETVYYRQGHHSSIERDFQRAINDAIEQGPFWPDKVRPPLPCCRPIDLAE
jgi:hypothetical protein